MDKQEYLDNQIQKNIDILIKLNSNFKSGKKSDLHIMRKHFAVYRLYKLGIDCKLIACFYMHDSCKIRQIIGEIFSYFCLNDNKCVFKKVLENG